MPSLIKLQLKILDMPTIKFPYNVKKLLGFSMKITLNDSFFFSQNLENHGKIWLLSLF